MPHTKRVSGDRARMGKGPAVLEASSAKTTKLVGTFSFGPPLCLGDPYIVCFCLYDVVTRIPPPSLKLERDDRQAKLWYVEERAKMLQAHKTRMADSAVAKPAPVVQWYSMKIDGRLIDLLVDESGQVANQRPHGG